MFDVSKIAGCLEVRYAAGDEPYVTFSGEIENPVRPDAREVIFAEHAGRAHAGRWANRQSGYSAVQDTTRDVLIVPEAMHGSAAADVQQLTPAIADEIELIWATTPAIALLTPSSPRFEF